MDFLVLKYLLWAVALGALTAFPLPLGSAIGLKTRQRATLISLLDEKALRFWFIKWRMGLQLALFGDVGTAWYTGPEFGENFIAGFGGGLRLTIPVVVLLRLDVAHAKDQFGLTIAIGGAEKAIAQKQRVR